MMNAVYSELERLHNRDDLDQPMPYFFQFILLTIYRLIPDTQEVHTYNTYHANKKFYH